MKVISVKFKENGRSYYFDPCDFEIKEGDYVIVTTARGTECGEVVRASHEVPGFSREVKPVIRVADAVDINPVYLSRMLKKYRNLKPLEYIHQKRIEKAKQLLGQGVTVKDTLPQVGYSSALTMNRAFRRFEDTTPGAFYREK